MRLFAPVALLAAAPLAWAAPNVAAAVHKAVGLVARQNNGSDSGSGAFNINLIPSGCDQPCTTYKSIFGTCPNNPSDSVCAQACNQTVHNEFNVCMSCVVNNGPAAGMQQHDIDILNIAQQNLVQQCINEGYPATFSGTVTLPKSVAYPSGVVNATYASNGSASATPSMTSASAAASSSAAASPSEAAASPSASKPAAATRFQPALIAVVIAAAGVAALC